MNDQAYGGSDILSDEDILDVDKSYEKILDGLYKKVRDSDEAKKWLNAPLGQSFVKFLAADKMRTMKECAIEADPSKLRDAQIEFAAVCKIEVIFGTLITDGIEALNELNSRNAEG